MENIKKGCGMIETQKTLKFKGQDMEYKGWHYGDLYTDCGIAWIVLDNNTSIQVDINSIHQSTQNEWKKIEINKKNA